MEVHYASANDLSSIVPLFEEYLKFYDRKHPIDEVTKFLDKRLRNEESIFLFAVHEEEVIGFTQLYPSFSSLSLKRCYILNDLFVTADKRKLGAAEALMEEAFAFCEQSGAVYISLETHPDNTASQKLYEKVGMTKDDEYWHYMKSF